jgi:hypothetical protein
MVHVGATGAFRKELYRAAGGLDTGLRLGEDAELGCRLFQAGAVFVPEAGAGAWHLGRSHMMRHERLLRRYNRPFLADRMPHPRWLRRVGGSGWSVPLVRVVVEVDGQRLERVRAAVDAILRGHQRDLRVDLVGRWGSISQERVSPLADPGLDLRLVAATYRSDPRVRLVEHPPDSGFPSPYLLRVPVSCGLAAGAVPRLVGYADRHRRCLVRVAPPAGRGPGVELWRTAAISRAGWVRRNGETLAEAVAEVHGAATVTPQAAGVVDLSRVRLARLAAGADAPSGGAAQSGRWLPSSVEVAGVRSLARAAVLVARLAAARILARVRVLGGGRRGS